MIEIKGIRKKFEDVTAIADVSISVEKGSIFGIVGRKGAGKTTLIECMTGIHKPDQGDITMGGSSVYKNPRVKAKMGYVADEALYFPSYKIKEMVTFYNKTYPTFEVSKFNDYNAVFKLDDNQKVDKLSKEMKMRLSLMLNLAINPEVLILDEPTSGLDGIAKKEIQDILLQEVTENKLTVFISSSHLKELEDICDELAFMREGEITYVGSLDKMKQNMVKLQVIFQDQEPEDLTEWEEIHSVETVGKVHYIITRQYSKALEDKLEQAGATMIEPIKLNLEEMFMGTCTEEYNGE